MFVSRVFLIQALLQDSTLKSVKFAGPEIIVKSDLKRNKRQTDMVFWYLSTKFLLFATNICERLFPVTEQAISNRRKRVLYSNFERQLFLYMNRHVWDVIEIKGLVNDITLQEGR